MIKRKQYKLYVIFCAVIACVCCFLPFLLKEKTKANAEYSVETSAELRESYMLGETFTIPDGALVQGETRYQAEQSMLVFPDGTINANKEQVLSQTGNYTVLYTAKVGENNVVAQKAFSVVDSYYSFSGESADNGAFECVDSFNMAPGSDLSGVRVRIPKGSTFNVNEAFDVSDLTKDNPVITLYPYNNTFLMGKNGKTIQANDIQIILTDYYDPNNYIVLTFHWVKAAYVSPTTFTSPLNYWAGVADSPMYCMTPSSADGSFDYNGVSYTRMGTYYGINAYYLRSDLWKDAAGNDISHNAMNAALPEGAVYSESVGLSLYYDQETMSVYASDTNAKKFVTNLGLSEVYGEKAFKGFTGDKFYLSIRGDDYRTSSGTSTNDLAVDFEISNILGRSGSDLHTANMPNDDVAPLIQVDGQDGTFTVAKGETIKIPTPVIKDVNFKSLVSEVYFGYGTPQQTLVAIEDGTVVFSRLGDYTIVYTAEDTFGNVSVAKIGLKCKIFPDNRSLRLQVEEVESPEAGAILSLPTYALEGNVGKTVKISYAYGDGVFTEVKDDAFFVEHVGKYTLRYEYSDFLVSYVYEYEFTSVPSDNIAFNLAALPKYFVKGSTYTLERLKAFKYTEADPTECDIVTYVSEDGGAFYEIDANAYEVKADNTVRFKYVLGGREEFSATVPVVSGLMSSSGRYFASKHFITTDFDFEEKDASIEFKPTNPTVSTMEFVNPISLSNLYLDFLLPLGESNYDGVEVTLTDYYDYSRSFTVRYKRQWTESGGGYYHYIVSCNGSTVINYETHYENTPLQIYYENGKIIAADGVFDVDGIVSTDKVLLTIAIKNATVGESRLVLRKLNNVVFSAYLYDTTRPQLYYEKDCAIYEKLGKEITIYPAMATDVLSAFVIDNLSMWVEGPNRSAVTALDGTVLNAGIDVTKEYTFRLDQTGVYTVYYKYVDTNGNPYTSEYKIYILDDEAPTLTLDGGYNENTVVTVKKGKAYTVQTYKVEDNKTAAENLIVSVMAYAPDFCVSPVKNGKIVFNAKGTWRIYYYCLDEMGNCSLTYYTVKVK